MPNQRELTVKVHDEGPDGLWADVAELPGLFASGDTPDELLESLSEAVSVYLEMPVKLSGWGPALGKVEEHKLLVDA